MGAATSRPRRFRPLRWLTIGFAGLFFAGCSLVAVAISLELVATVVPAGRFAPLDRFLDGLLEGSFGNTAWETSRVEGCWKAVAALPPGMEAFDELRIDAVIAAHGEPYEVDSRGYFVIDGRAYLFTYGWWNDLGPDVVVFEEERPPIPPTWRWMSVAYELKRRAENDLLFLAGPHTHMVCYRRCE